MAAAGAPETWLKLECWQPTGSFKVRGALHNMATLDAAARGRGVVAASAGNHALGVAFAGSALGGFQTTVYVPETAPRAKVDKLRSFAVAVEVGGLTYDDAHDRAGPGRDWPG
jgi:threonine dehydratase